MSRVVPTLWSGQGPGAAWKQPTVRAFLEDLRPPCVRIHTSAPALASGGKRLTDEIRAALPGVDVWWAIAGDGNGPDPSVVWANAARAAVDAGVAVLEVDPEAAWKKRPKGLARKCAVAMREAAPGLVLGHTSYDGPVSVVVGKGPGGRVQRWGGHMDYPWAEFLGEGSPITYSAPQVYWAMSKEPAELRGQGLVRLANHKQSWEAARRAGLVKAGLRTDVYLQAHGCRLDELCHVGTKYEYASFWVCTEGYLDAQGMLAMKALAALNRLGFVGSAAITQFQASKGLDVDGWVGPATLRALGVTA